MGSQLEILLSHARRCTRVSRQLNFRSTVSGAGQIVTTRFGATRAKLGLGCVRPGALARAEVGARHLYEAIYGARGEMENRIKEVPARPVRRSHLGGDNARQSAAALVRLHGLRVALRPAPDRPGPHPVRAQATCGTIRLKLLKIGSACGVKIRHGLRRGLTRTRQRSASPNNAADIGGGETRPGTSPQGGAAAHVADGCPFRCTPVMKVDLRSVTLVVRMAHDAVKLMRTGTRGCPSWPGQTAHQAVYVDADW
jgi:hypothetical protein